MAKTVREIMRIITPTQLDSKIKGKKSIYLIDVNEVEDYDEENFGNTINVPASTFTSDLPSEFEDIDEYDEIVLIDDTGDLSRQVATKLKNFGYTKVTILEGGIQNWYAQGYE